ncbi:MAG TPA: hydroxyethylthiazole kinase [Ruania sp.]|nr:hydroxyethylthiazole kinase [Ruania sp.]
MRPADPDLQRAWPVLTGVRQQQPVVHCITAAVSMGIVADGLLAAGARPMMTETVAEAPVVTEAADALLVNLGTLSTEATAAIPATVEVTSRAGRPWVLDPTAIGRAPVRTPLARRLLRERPAVVRGNASELLALAGESDGGRGADSVAAPHEAARAGERVAERTGGAVAVSGAVDLVVSGQQRAELDLGTPLLTRVTGTGCLLAALTAACAAVTQDHFDAALAASTWMALAGEQAAAVAPRPGSFRAALLDALGEVADER